MPVTFAHPVAVLPLRRTPLPTSALVIGSMVPDVPLFLPWAPLDYATTHTPLGLLTVDVVIGVLVWAHWHAVIRAPVVDAAPSPLRRRITSACAPRGVRAVLVPAAVALGAATHVLWDEFTHVGRWGERHITWLAEIHAGLPGVKWAQYVSGVGGLLILAVVVAILSRRTPPAPQTPRTRPRLAPWILATPAGAVVLTAAVVVATASEISLRSVAYGVITQGAVAGVVVLTPDLPALARGPAQVTALVTVEGTRRRPHPDRVGPPIAPAQSASAAETTSRASACTCSRCSLPLNDSA